MNLNVENSALSALDSTNSLPPVAPKSSDTMIMYILANTTLKMGKGKIAAQCCHGACRVVRILEQLPVKPSWYSKWYHQGTTKVVLKCDEPTMMDILARYGTIVSKTRIADDIWCVPVNDAGRTQIAAGSLTVLAFRPMLKEEAPDCIKMLKLL